MSALTLAMMLWIASAGGAEPQARAAETRSEGGTVRGRVTAADTGHGLARARLSIATASPTSDGRPIVVTTNSQGRFQAAGVPAGLYYVSALRGGYLATEYGQRRPKERGLTVEVADGREAAGIDIALARAGVVSGRITDDLGEPYPGVRVDVLGMRYERGVRQPYPVGVATTDDLGQYRIAGLPPGAYYIVASSTETWKNEKNEVYGYASTYFPGGPLSMAQLAELGPSEHRRDLSFSLHTSRAARISGRLQRETGEPVAGAGVSLAYSYPGVVMTGGMRSVRTGSDGAFEIRDVPGGTYSVGGGSAAQIVTVDGTDIDGLVLVPKTGSTVSGILVTDEGTPPPFPNSGVRVLNEAPSGNVLPRVAVASFDADWSFRFTNLGGTFLFRVIGLPDGWTMKSIHVGEKEVTDTPWDVPTGGREFTDMRITVTRQIGRVTGVVLDQDGAATASASAVVFSQDDAHWFPYSRRTRFVRPSADGRFGVEGLPPGRYFAAAREFIEQGQWENRAFLEEARGDAVRFELVEGGSQSVTVTLPERR